jgi:two-component system sensor histidine kinase DesK
LSLQPEQFARRSRRLGLLFAAGYLAFLIQPVAAQVTSLESPWRRAAMLVGLAALVALHLGFWARASFPERLGTGAVALAAMCAVATALTLAQRSWIWLFIYCTVMAAATTLEWRMAAAFLASVLGLAAAVGMIAHLPVGDFAIVFLVMALAGAGMLALGRALDRQHHLHEKARLAVAEERLRFARDLHDLLGHTLSVIVLKSELAGRLAAGSPEAAIAQLRDIERVAREALREVREAVAGYREPSLSQELDSGRATLAAAGVALEHHLPEGQLPVPVDSTLAWALREGVTNILRHSRAHQARVTIARHQDRVEMELLDDGVGCDGCRVGNGLRGLGERIAVREGSLNFGPRPGGGFRLAVRLPLTQAARPA